MTCAGVRTGRGAEASISDSFGLTVQLTGNNFVHFEPDQDGFANFNLTSDESLLRRYGWLD